MSATKTATIGAWLPAHASIKAAHAEEADALRLINEAGFADGDMNVHGWVRIGSATISIDLLPTKDLTEQHISALRNEQAALQAKSALLEQQINSLLALTYTQPPEVA